MNALNNIEGLEECIGRAIQGYFAKSDIQMAWPQIDGLARPVIRFEAFLEDASPGNAIRRRSDRIASVRSLLYLVAMLL